MMKIGFITQEDSFTIPQNIQRVLSLRGIEAALIAAVDCKNSLDNRKLTFAKGFGSFQASRMAAEMIFARFMDLLDSGSVYRLLDRKRSIKAVARCNNIPFRRIQKVNDEPFVSDIEALHLDLIISYSAPTVFGPRLLKAARLGCINLHCSPLPLYAGVLPSFWVLYDRATEGGATVHFMDDKIDNGAILAQRKIPVPPHVSMFRWIHMTKAVGGELMAETVVRLRDGKIEPMPNDISVGSYYSWPTIQQMQEFRMCGGRLI